MELNFERLLKRLALKWFSFVWNQSLNSHFSDVLYAEAVAGMCSAKKAKKVFSRLYDCATTDLATFTEEILNGKLHFLC